MYETKVLVFKHDVVSLLPSACSSDLQIINSPLLFGKIVVFTKWRLSSIVFKSMCKKDLQSFNAFSTQNSCY